MKEIKIIKIHYKYFKGLTDSNVVLNGKSAIVKGRNADGKTSLADGLVWLFFGKDTKGRKLSPKPLNGSNDELLGLEPEVETTLSIDGQQVTLKRVQKEVWTKKNGELEATRSNDTTKYFIDDVPKLEKEWKAFISDIASETVIELLINPNLFMEIKWEDRRKILIAMTGLTDEEIIKRDPTLAGLTEVLDGKSVEDAKKILANQKKEIAAAIDGIPGRIQENVDGKNNLGLAEFELEKVKENIEVNKKLVVELQDKLTVIQNGDGSFEHREKISELKMQQSELRTQFLSDMQLATQTLQEDVNTAQQKVNTTRNEKNEADSAVYRLEQAIAEKEEIRSKLISEYHAINNMNFDEHKRTCVMCQQALPEDQIEKLIENFKRDKSIDLEKNKEKVTVQKATKDDIANLQNELAVKKQLFATLTAELTTAVSKLDLINNELLFQKDKQGAVETSDVYIKLQKDIDLTQIKLSNAQTDNSEEVKNALEKLTEAKNSLTALEHVELRFSQIDSFEKRIAELKAEDKKLKEQNLEVQKKLSMIDEFIKAKVRILEESINSKFELVKFKLFNEQKNGGLKEICEATYNGIGYSSSLNNSARIKCDIDIINSLSKSYGLTLPLFVDNVEAVNVGNLPESVGQRIELRVAEEKGLKVEVLS